MCVVSSFVCKEVVVSFLRGESSGLVVIPFAARYGRCFMEHIIVNNVSKSIIDVYDTLSSNRGIITNDRPASSRAVTLLTYA